MPAPPLSSAGEPLLDLVTNQTFWLHSDRSYDYVVHDVFTGGGMAAPLFSVGFLNTLRTKVLKEETGVLALNFYGFVEGPGVIATAAVVWRLQEAGFKHVRTFGNRPLARSRHAFLHLISFHAHRFTKPSLVHVTLTKRRRAQ